MDYECQAKRAFKRRQTKALRHTNSHTPSCTKPLRWPKPPSQNDRSLCFLGLFFSVSGCVVFLRMDSGENTFKFRRRMNGASEIRRLSRSEGDIFITTSQLRLNAFSWVVDDRH